jgi:hypothetical protein
MDLMEFGREDETKMEVAQNRAHLAVFVLVVLNARLLLSKVIYFAVGNCRHCKLSK